MRPKLLQGLEDGVQLTLFTEPHAIYKTGSQQLGLVFENIEGRDALPDSQDCSQGVSNLFLAVTTERGHRLACACMQAQHARTQRAEERVNQAAPQMGRGEGVSPRASLTACQSHMMMKCPKPNLQASGRHWTKSCAALLTQQIMLSRYMSHKCQQLTIVLCGWGCERAGVEVCWGGVQVGRDWRKLGHAGHAGQLAVCGEC